MPGRQRIPEARFRHVRGPWPAPLAQEPSELHVRLEANNERVAYVRLRVRSDDILELRPEIDTAIDVDIVVGLQEAVAQTNGNPLPLYTARVLHCPAIRN